MPAKCRNHYLPTFLPSSESGEVPVFVLVSITPGVFAAGRVSHSFASSPASASAVRSSSVRRPDPALSHIFQTIDGALRLCDAAPPYAASRESRTARAIARKLCDRACRGPVPSFEPSNCPAPGAQSS